MSKGETIREATPAVVRSGGFFTFSQNNSGGSFVYRPTDGIGQYVIVEAENASDANRRAEDIGVYFDDENDCSCCGSRWSEVDDYDKTEEPSIYEEPISDYDFKWNRSFARKGDYIAFVHYMDGRIDGYK